MKRPKKHRILQRIELKCLEMKEMMYQTSDYLQYSVEEIENRVVAFRNMLLDKEGIDESSITEKVSNSDTQGHSEEIKLAASEKVETKEVNDSKRKHKSSKDRSCSVGSSGSSTFSPRRSKRTTKSPSNKGRTSHYYDSSSTQSRSVSRSPSIRRRKGSPSHLDKRRITSARKRPVPYHRPSPTEYSSSDRDDLDEYVLEDGDQLIRTFLR